jgi:nicotinate-nucleotide adenylyltransferase
MKPTNKMQQDVSEVFGKAFGRTPLMQRVDDIFREATELSRFTDFKNLKEEAGDLLASLLALMNEMDWQAEDVLKECLDKIARRQEQYRILGRKYTVAILGGAFDPVTLGHISVAQHVLKSTSFFDEVWLMPCYKHMYNKKMESSDHRLKMCELAVQAHGSIRVCPYEIEQRLAGETYQLVKTLMEEDFAKHQYDFSFVIGMDNANTFDLWVNFRELERMVRFVVVPRPGIVGDDSVLWYRRPPHIVLPPSNSIVDTSSTYARNAICRGDFKAVENSLDPKVMEYIREHHLYQGNNQGGK